MSCQDEIKRITIKQGVGIATIPATSDHRDGTWLNTDIYIGEFYQDSSTGIIYNRDAVGLTINGEPVRGKYRATLTQTGTGAPTATILANTIGSIVWSYVSTGVYQATLSGVFTANKTSIITGGGVKSTVNINAYRKTTSVIEVYVTNSGALANGELNETAISIEIFL